MRTSAAYARVVLVILIGLLALPIATIGSPVEAKNRPRTVTRTYATPYDQHPQRTRSPLPGFGGVLSSTSGRQAEGHDPRRQSDPDGFAHDDPQDIQVLLAGPGGQTTMVMAYIGGGQRHRLTLSSTTRPRSHSRIKPAPKRHVSAHQRRGQPHRLQRPGAERSANWRYRLRRDEPNGTWRLFVQDEYGPTAAGAFAGGWDLELKAKAKKKRR